MCVYCARSILVYSSTRPYGLFHLSMACNRNYNWSPHSHTQTPSRYLERIFGEVFVVQRKFKMYSSSARMYTVYDTCVPEWASSFLFFFHLVQIGFVCRSAFTSQYLHLCVYLLSNWLLDCSLEYGFQRHINQKNQIEKAKRRAAHGISVFESAIRVIHYIIICELSVRFSNKIEWSVCVPVLKCIKIQMHK